MKKLWLLIGLIPVIAVAAYLGVSAVLYNRLATVAPHCNGEFTENTPADFSAGRFAPDLDTSPYYMKTYEKVSMKSRDSGIELSGWYVPGQVDKPVILVVHGLGVGTVDCKNHPRALIPAGMLNHAGYSVLLIDLRNHGESTIDGGKWAAGTKEYRDVLGAWDWWQPRGVYRSL